MGFNKMAGRFFRLGKCIQSAAGVNSCKRESNDISGDWRCLCRVAKMLLFLVLILIFCFSGRFCEMLRNYREQNWANLRWEGGSQKTFGMLPLLFNETCPNLKVFAEKGKSKGENDVGD